MSFLEKYWCCHFDKETISINKVQGKFVYNIAVMSVGGPVIDRKANTAKEMKLASFAMWCHETSKISPEALIFHLASGWFE